MICVICLTFSLCPRARLETKPVLCGFQNFEAGNKDYTITVYAGVGHGFMNESPEPYATEKAKDEGFEAIGIDKTFYPYNATVADEAWGSLFDFFGKYL